MSALLKVSQALKNPGQIYPLSLEMELEPVEMFAEQIAFGPVRLEGSYLGAGEVVTLTGVLTSEAILHCARCLAEVRVPLRAEVDERFSRAADPNAPDQYLFEGSEIDLTDCVRENLLLQIPMRVLCSPECKGLCPVCGSNRNLVSCTCLEGGEVANPFSALKAMVEENEEV
ncbi:MAG TPA: DUF177 domain-containing protein [Candidatus Pullichristensenella excrementigallinarum]|uniref:DUF177 domain-containing protein n=1 Tax=Candidatus Pullichristensenella excrementigallinarum TaxID=2840907 RepID=A0A9D1IBI4_9FIRM|nr:DUF177 domain-containing protein [Candidatus Pullichristensenella excrementigallinarum]